MYLLQGVPGSGKTTLALQFLLEAARRGDRTLYVTLSETRGEIDSVARSHGWTLDRLGVLELSAMKHLAEPTTRQTMFHSAEVELHEVVTQHGLGTGAPHAAVDVSYLADNVVLLRYFEAQGRVRQVISVFKKRSGRHERTIREFTMSDRGLDVGPPLAQFEGVLTGAPIQSGARPLP